LTPTLALKALAAGAGGKAGAPEKSTKKALPLLLCFAQTESAAAAAAAAAAALVVSAAETIELLAVVESRATKKA
jgi:hypothetical protein